LRYNKYEMRSQFPMMHTDHPLLPWGLLLASSVSLGSLDASAQGGETTDSSSIECVSLTSITRTEVLDEQTILFHMVGQETYTNYLPRECPGLDERARFTYKTSTGKLCNSDTITLLERGPQLRPGITCRLGEFLPASAGKVLDLTLGEDSRGARPGAIEVRRAQLPPAADAEPPPPAASSPTDAPPPPEDTER
jgi:hypothetical protein